MSETNTQSNKDSWVARFIKNRLSRMPETYRQNSVNRELIEHAQQSYEEWDEYTPDTPRAIEHAHFSHIKEDNTSKLYLYEIELEFHDDVYTEMGFVVVDSDHYIHADHTLNPRMQIAVPDTSIGSRYVAYKYLEPVLSKWWGSDTHASGDNTELENNRYYNKDKTKWVKLKQLRRTDGMVVREVDTYGNFVGSLRVEFVSERIWRYVLKKLKLFYMTWYKQDQIWGSPSKFALGLYILLTKAVRPKE